MLQAQYRSYTAITHGNTKYDRSQKQSRFKYEISVTGEIMQQSSLRDQDQEKWLFQ